MTKTLTIGLNNDNACITLPWQLEWDFSITVCNWEPSNQPEQWDPPRNHDQVAIRPHGIVRIPQFMQLLSENWVLKLPNIKRVQYRIEHVFKENWPPNYCAIVICSFPVHLKGKAKTIFKIQYEKNYNWSFFRKKSSFNQLHLSFVLCSDVNLNYRFHVSHAFLLSVIYVLDNLARF